MKHSPLVASLLCATALYAAPAFAQDTDQDDDGDAIIVTGEKEPGDLIVDAQELERTSANSLEDIFANKSSSQWAADRPLRRKSMCAGLRM